ncbi:MAG TPA: heat-inducible transcriptional repressor HrcA [Parvularculaceae bacterium]|nr:heat-inducible transcriptional repressor HrcA [Parvularculaceae bacterium]HNS85466.1 heat-inducible transcriptional repressor HrcA [Parvularculaceae bacterium]
MSVLNDIDARAREIFRQIVEAYLESGEPVGSRTLSHDPRIAASAATIRNVMADLTDLGLLHAPHISAGRLPTEFGLRLFVDSLLQLGDLSEDERRAFDIAAEEEDAGTVLEQAAAKLSGLTRSASLVVAPKAEAPLRHIEFVATSPGQALVVLVFEDGRVENRIMATPEGLPASALIAAGNYLSARLRGRTISETRDQILKEIETNKAALDDLTARLVREGVAEFSSGERASLIVRGRGHLLDETAAHDLERVRMLFDDLERKRDVIDVLNAAKEADGVKIFIGSENRLFSLTGSSVVAAPYRDADRNIVGVLGVIGPTRLNYARVIPIVDYAARSLSRRLK